MEDSIGSFTNTLASFCNHLESSCTSLSRSMELRPIPLDSASSTFIQSMNRRVATVSSDLNLVESMSLGTVSFEELLGHSYEIFKKNQNDINEIEEQLKPFGYHPELDIDNGCDDVCESTPNGFESKLRVHKEEYKLPYAGSVMKSREDNPHLLDDSVILQNLGFSDAYLASLASNAKEGINRSTQSNKHIETVKEPHESAVEAFKCEPESVINICKDDYEGLPSYMKCLTSWEDLVDAVEKMNSYLIMKANGKGSFFSQSDLSSLDLGVKGKSYLLLLVRLNRLVTENDGDVDGGSISYRVL